MHWLQFRDTRIISLFSAGLKGWRLEISAEDCETEFQHPQPCSHLLPFLFPMNHAVLPSFSWNSLFFSHFPCPLNRNFWNSSVPDLHTLQRSGVPTQKPFLQGRHRVCELMAQSSTHHDLDLPLADLQVVLIIDIHPLQGTLHPIARPHQEHDCKATCGGQRITWSLTRNLFGASPVPARVQQGWGHWAAPALPRHCSAGAHRDPRGQLISN